MTKYIIGEFFSSCGATLYKNASDQTMLFYLGVLATTILVAIIVTVVMINLRDFREYRKFLAREEANKNNWAVQMNPLFKENTTTNENLGHGRR